MDFPGTRSMDEVHTTPKHRTMANQFTYPPDQFDSSDLILIPVFDEINFTFRLLATQNKDKTARKIYKVGRKVNRLAVNGEA